VVYQDTLTQVYVEPLERNPMSSTTAAEIETKRVNFVLSGKAHSELVTMAKRNRRSMTELVRLGLGLVKIALEAEQNGHKLIVTTADGQPLKEIVLPG
jgi:hypothetical protein